MLHDNIEFYDEDQIIEWLKVYNTRLDVEFLPEIGFSVWEVQREYFRRIKIQETMENWKAGEL